MLPPEQDESTRRPIWSALQQFWTDSDPGPSLRSAAEICARSKYTVSEIEAIFWNEVRPAVQANLRSIAGEWAGFDIDWLSQRILKTHRFGRRLPVRALHSDDNAWWTKLRAEIERIRQESS